MGFALIEDAVNDAGETVKVRLSNARVVDAYGRVHGPQTGAPSKLDAPQRVHSRRPGARHRSAGRRSGAS